MATYITINKNLEVRNHANARHLLESILEQGGTHIDAPAHEEKVKEYEMVPATLTAEDITIKSRKVFFGDLGTGTIIGKRDPSGREDHHEKYYVAMDVGQQETESLSFTADYMKDLIEMIKGEGLEEINRWFGEPAKAKTVTKEIPAGVKPITLKFLRDATYSRASEGKENHIDIYDESGEWQVKVSVFR